MPRLSNVVARYNETVNPTTFAGDSPYKREWFTGNTGTSSSDACFDATDVYYSRQAAGLSTSNGNYWIQPDLSQPAFQVAMVLNYDGRHYSMVMSFDNDYGFDAKTNWMRSNWAGWAAGSYNEVVQINSGTGGWTKAINSNVKTLTPAYALCPMRSIMITRNDNGGSVFRGVMDNSTVEGGENDPQGPISVPYQNSNTYYRAWPSMRAVVMQPQRKKGASVINGNLNWPGSFWVRGDTNGGYNGGSYWGFKMNSDSSGNNASSVYGGGMFTSGWSCAQLGCGRDNTSENYWGGGIGSTHPGNTTANSSISGGHWWGHGSGRNSSAWTGDSSGFMNGHSLWVCRY